jgi:LacI family gluconate utilization system Gnt-I transcriptional repressor
MKKHDTRGTGKVMLVDVARVAGVSKITASRALSNPDIVSPETRQKAKDAVVLTGYIPNLIAGGLRSNRSRLIACIVPTIASGSAFLVAVQALTEAFGNSGYQVILAQRGYDPSQEESLIEAIVARRPDGIVLMGMLRSPDACKRLKNTGIPVVEAWDMTPSPIDMLVGFSHEDAGAAICRYLHGKGRRQPGMIVSTEPRSKARERGFLRAARELGLDLESIASCSVGAPTRMAHGRQGLAELLRIRPDIDAVYCASDLVALGALTEAQTRRIKVPRQLAIIGFGDLDFAVDTAPPLTTVHIDSTEIGRQAAAMIIARIAGEPIKRNRVDLGFSIVERGSA